jgi:hypothetical protein
MKLRACGALLALGLAVGLHAPASAQSKPSIAIMPTQYFSATADSAQAVTDGLTSQFEGRGYAVMAADKSRSTFQSLNLDPSTHYADSVALRYGRSMGADLVAYPRLLATGIPLANPRETPGGFLVPNAILHLRVLNVHTGRPIYFRQIHHDFSAGSDVASTDFNLPQPVATATAEDATGQYFERVAGSRQEITKGR